mmetsp:Transcript_12260/g.23278  ORF Transcript_12260/g.23278 Transcript_12260/m.23278 type:complete len:229 (-) Transcript_12260:331-1017(-)
MVVTWPPNEPVPPTCRVCSTSSQSLTATAPDTFRVPPTIALFATPRPPESTSAASSTATASVSSVSVTLPWSVVFCRTYSEPCVSKSPLDENSLSLEMLSVPPITVSSSMKALRFTPSPPAMVTAAVLECSASRVSSMDTVAPMMTSLATPNPPAVVTAASDTLRAVDASCTVTRPPSTADRATPMPPLVVKDASDTDSASVMSLTSMSDANCDCIPTLKLLRTDRSD